jgi:hypothetical protein
MSMCFLLFTNWRAAAASPPLLPPLLFDSFIRVAIKPLLGLTKSCFWRGICEIFGGKTSLRWVQRPPRLFFRLGFPPGRFRPGGPGEKWVFLVVKPGPGGILAGSAAKHLGKRDGNCEPQKEVVAGRYVKPTNSPALGKRFHILVNCETGWSIRFHFGVQKRQNYVKE